jgi:DNA mismatch repair ATPase MutS
MLPLTPALSAAACLVNPQSWLKAPLVDPAAIRQRLDIVEAFVTDQALREGVRDALRGERDTMGTTTLLTCGTHTLLRNQVFK